MLAHNFAASQHNFPGLGLQVRPEKFRNIDFADKTDALGIFLFGRRQLELPGQGADFRLLVFP